MSKSNQTGKKPLDPVLKAAMERVYKAEGIPGFETPESSDKKNEGYCPVKLWHGTSAHLLPMIKKYGLGGQNVLVNWNVMEFLSWTFENLDEWDPNDFTNPDHYSLNLTRAAIDEARDPNLPNFEYGHLYVTGQYHKAESYAQTAPELLDLVRLILDIARRQNKTIIEQKLEQFSEIKSFLRLPPQPIVIELPSVLITNLKGENGEEIDDFMSKEMQQDKLYWELMSYRINAVIPFEEIIEIYPIKQTT